MTMPRSLHPSDVLGRGGRRSWGSLAAALALSITIGAAWLAASPAHAETAVAGATAKPLTAETAPAAGRAFEETLRLGRARAADAPQIGAREFKRRVDAVSPPEIARMSAGGLARLSRPDAGSDAANGETNTLSTPTTPTCYRFDGSNAPCDFRFGFPTGTPKGILIVPGGGGWASNKAIVDWVHSQVEGYVTAGFTVFTVEHTNRTINGSPGFGPAGGVNIAQWYDYIRYLADIGYGGPGMRICMYGKSSGGHFALMTGIVRPGLHCVITEGAPTNLNAAIGHPSSELARDEAFVGATPAETTHIRTLWSPMSSVYPASSGYLLQGTLMAHLPDDQVVSAGSHLYNLTSGRTAGQLTAYTLVSGGPCWPFAHACFFGQPGVETNSFLNWFNAVTVWGQFG